jgi:hypothetical protein
MISGIRNSGGGQKGEIGQKGERGLQGLKGDRGDRGLTGMKGEKVSAKIDSWSSKSDVRCLVSSNFQGRQYDRHAKLHQLQLW